jgi:hypothetical protein
LGISLGAQPGDAENRVYTVGVSPVNTLRTVLCPSMVVPQIFKWFDFKKYFLAGGQC